MLSMEALAALAASRQSPTQKRVRAIVVNGIVLTTTEASDTECVASTKTEGLESPRLK